jgi:hypothetical protein
MFQITGQQLSVSATRTNLSRLEEHFGGYLPSPAELLHADPQVLRASGLSTRKGATLRALAERFVDGRLIDEALAGMTDDEIEADRGIGHRPLDGARVPDLRSRPTRRAPARRPRTSARCSTAVRPRPPPHRRTDGRGDRALAAVPECRGELPVRLGIRGTTVMDRSSSFAIRPPVRSHSSIDGDHPASARRQRGAVSRQPTPRREKN